MVKTLLPGLGRPWARFAINRIGGLVISFVLLIVITFLIIPLIPGDPAVAAAGEGASPADIERVREQLGLSAPLLTQFVDYISGVFTLDLGTSFASGYDVWAIIVSRLPYTAQVAFLAIALVLAIGVPIGLLVAVATRGGKNAWLDRAFDLLTGLLFTIPTYVLGTALILVFAISLNWLPAGGSSSWSAMILPTAALMVGPTSVIARTVRREATVVMEQDYIRTARGWRITPARIQLRYVLPNLLTTTLTLSGLILAGMLGGSVVIETVFAWPGIGQALVDAILVRDYPLIRGLVLVIGMLATALVIVVDLLLALVDPRNLDGVHDHA